MSIVKGLVIAEPWISKILAGEKTWEMRSTSVSNRGPIALIKKGSGTIVGVVSIVGATGPYDDDDMAMNFSKHHVPESMVKATDYNWRYAWHLENAIAFDRPVPYQHPNGAVVWVNFSPETQKAVSTVLQNMGEGVDTESMHVAQKSAATPAGSQSKPLNGSVGITHDNSSSIFYVPVARDGTTFHKGLKNTSGFYTVGDRKAEKKYESYEEALAYLKSVPVARWRRPNKKGVAGIVSAIDWVSVSQGGA